MGLASSLAHIFKILAGIPSTPVALLGSRFFKTVSTSRSVVSMLINRFGFTTSIITEGVTVDDGIEKTGLKQLLNDSAFFKGSVTIVLSNKTA